MDSLLAKADKAAELFDKLNASINSEYLHSTKEFNKPAQLPSFLNIKQPA